MSTYITDETGQTRKLAYTRPDPSSMLMRASHISIRSYRTKANCLDSKGNPAPVIPRFDWKATNNVKAMGNPDKFLLDQQDCGGCTGWSSTGGLMRVRAVRGRSLVRLSGACVYAQINGGHDNGSNIIDSMHALNTKGTCTEAEMNYPHIMPSEIPSNVLYWYKDLQVTVDDFDEVVTAILMGMFPQFPIYVGNNFEQYTSEGVAGYTRSNQGNHSIYGADLVYLSNGKPVILIPNSWGLKWGPFVNSKPEWAGCVLITEAHVNDCAYDEDGYAHTSDIAPDIVP